MSQRACGYPCAVLHAGCELCCEAGQVAGHQAGLVMHGRPARRRPPVGRQELPASVS